MERHRFFVEIIDRSTGKDIRWSNQQWETVVECRYAQEGQRMVESQYGGPQNCRVTWRGQA
jgi:hypothetical protein